MAQTDRSGPVRAIAFMLVAIIASVAALVVVWHLIQNYQNQIQTAQQEEEMHLAIVAARTLYQGLTITEEDLIGVEMPFEYIPAGSFASPEEVVGRVPRERILANEFIRKERLADRSAGIGLNALISRGMRAVSINITNGSALSGFLNPGNYVDVLVTINPQVEGAGDDQTFTLLQAVYVLAVRARMVQDNMRSGAGEVRGRGSAPSVTLQVTPEQAEQLAHARQKGTITLLLRNDLDLQFTETQGATVKSLLGVDDKPKVKARRAPAPKPKQTLLIYKGTRSKEYTYDTPPSR